MKRFRNILVALDTRFENHPALDWASRLAEHNQASLTIVDVVPEFSWLTKLVMPDDEQVHRSVADDKKRKLDDLAEALGGKGIDVKTKVLTGKTSFAIIHEVLRSQHDLVVRVTKGAHSQGTGFFGTTSMRLLRKCPCAVWLVRPDDSPQFERVLAAIDPDPHDDVHEQLSKTVIELAQSVADYKNGDLHVIHSWELFGGNTVKSRLKPGELAEIELRARTESANQLDDFLRPYGMSHDSPHVHLVQDEIGAGHAVSELAQQREIDLVVMGTIGRLGVAGALMGNTAEHVLDHVECSVLAVKPDAFISPVTLPD